jgi:hypothetical protein
MRAGTRFAALHAEKVLFGTAARVHPAGAVGHNRLRTF